MIVLQSIRLRNFRAIREAVFQPHMEGLTGIQGPNGAGKSTFLAGTLFALFGVKPHGATVASLRRTGSGSDECSASVVFTHQGQTIEIIRELKGASNKVVVYIYVDGIPQTVTSVSAADTWIGQRLGIDSTGFLTAFIVRQKELDALITARPAERKAIIERLAGIDTINEALKKARKDENTAKAVLESLPGSAEKQDEAEAQVHLLSNKVNELEEIKETKQGTLKDYQTQMTNLNNIVEQFRDTETKLNTTRSRVAMLEASMESDQKTLTRLGPIIQAGTSFDIGKLREEHKQATEQINHCTQELNRTRVLASQLTERKQTLENSIASNNSLIETSDVVADERLVVSYGKELELVETEIQTLKQDNAVLFSKTEDYREKIVALSGEHKNCPTCNSVLHDVQGLVAGFEELVAEYSTKQVNNAQLIVEKETLKQEVHQKKQTVEQLLNIVEQINNDTALLNSTLEEINKLPDVQKLEEQISTLTVLKEEITENGFKAKQFVEAETEYNTASEAVKTKLTELNTLIPTVKTLEEEFTPAKYSEARTKLQETQNKANQLSNQLNEAFSELSNYQQRLSVANHNLRTAVEQWNRKKELLTAQEQKALTTEMIDKFRQDSIASLAPELSERATELISEITSGAYTEIRLDESFNVTVVNSVGETRDVSWLSGGEESAVAFALRIAIAFLITGDNPSLLWLDEVLTAQDADRRAAMLTTVRHLPIDQVILINHTEEAGDIVDQMVTVVPDLVNGSTIVAKESELPPVVGD